MKDRLIAFLFSTRTMSILLLVFAASMAAGTIIEHKYDTPTSKIWIYNTWWFSLLMFWLMINFIGNIKRYQLLRWKKWATLTLHLSWILIIIGAGITRYISFEGMMLIREGATENSFFSEETYINAIVQGADGEGNEWQKEYNDRLLISQYDYDYNYSDNFKDKSFSITIDTLIYDAVEGLIESETKGSKYLKIVEAGGGNRHDHLIADGQEESIHGVLFGVNIDPDEAREKGLINFIENWNGYTIQTPFSGDYLRMADQFKGAVVKDSMQPLQFRSLYSLAGMQFVIPEPIKQGIVGIIPSPEPTPQKAYGLGITVASGDKKETTQVLGGKGIISDYKDVEVNGMKFYLRYGSKSREVPFDITLEDFIATKYPGTEKGYSSFESKVLVSDGEAKSKERIFMNNVLDKDGYRFFQAGFDPDELGTHLSVNYDYWGKTITYAGYYLLYLGLLALIFDPNTRFGELGRMIKRVKKKKNKLITTLAILVMTSFSYAQQVDNHEGHDHEGHDHATHSTAASTGGVSTNLDEDDLESQPTGADMEPVYVPKIPVTTLDSIIVANLVPEAQARRFGRVIVQDEKGRMKPISTLANEILRKLHKKTYYEARVGDSTVVLSPEQTILSMIQLRQLWFEVPLIKLERKDDSLKTVLGLDKSTKYASGYDFFRNEDNSMGSYKLSPYLDAANQAKIKNGYQERIVDKNFKMGILDQVIIGSIFKVFPLPGEENNKWFSSVEWNEAGYTRDADKNFVRDFFKAYAVLVSEGNQTGDFLRANTALNSLFEFQKTYGADIYPSEDKIDAEILYNEYNIFTALYKWYAWFGIIMIILLVTDIIRPMKELRYAIKFHVVVLAILFTAHTAALGLRWYLSGHAPWSDAYETLIFIAWVIMAFGLFFSRKSLLTTAGAGFVAFIILWVAQLNWLDPSIGNLQPVLKGYWLMIHVSVIVASYGPFALGMILGFIALILTGLSTKKNKKRIDLSIKELTYINEVVLTVGLIMLTIGNFLGGMWANESWGRYWGWDPKETWALITIFIYAFVLHLRLVPGLRGRWTFNVWSIVAFLSVLMTYFGVNFYLSGLHSYASGDQIISYQGVGIFLLVVAVIAGLAKYKENTVFKKKKF